MEVGGINETQVEEVTDYKTLTLEARRFLNVGEKEWLNYRHLEKLVNHYRLSPVAFLYVGESKHWNLVITPKDNGLLTFDPLFEPNLRVVPLDRIRSEQYQQTQEHLLYYFKYNQGGVSSMQPNSLVSDRYSLPEEPLRELGRIQNDGYNCSIACVYAALIAKRSEEQILTGITRRGPIRTPTETPGIRRRTPGISLRTKP